MYPNVLMHMLALSAGASQVRGSASGIKRGLCYTSLLFKNEFFP